MTESIRKVLSPLLIISYVCGLRIIEFSIDNPKQWFSLLYILLFWTLYNFLTIYRISYIIYNSIEYLVCIGLHLFTALISIAIGVYYDKIFKNCIKKLTIVDDTLEKLGTTTNYHKFKMKIVWLTLGWSVIIILLTVLESYILKKDNMDILAAIFIPFMRNYCSYIHFIGDLIIAFTLGYIGLKFDQINEHLEKLSECNKHKIKLAWKHSVLCSRQCRFPKASTNEAYVTWIVMHLHSELCKICHEIDFIFGTQMTLEMGCYFATIIALSKEFFHIIFDENYINKILYTILYIFWFSIYIFRLLLINYVCEKVSTKANATGDFITRFLYPICNVEIRENILQFSLQIAQSPLRFYGLGLFQFGFRFVYRFFASILTVLVIYTQAFTSNTQLKNNN